MADLCGLAVPSLGTEVVQYDPPRPAQGSGPHRVVFLLYLQQAAIPSDDPALPKARSCQVRAQ